MKNNPKTKSKYIWGNTVAHEGEQAEGPIHSKICITWIQPSYKLMKLSLNLILEIIQYTTVIMTIMVIFITIGVV